MSPQPQGGPYLHATAVVVGEAGVLIRGASGSGKSALAIALLAEAAHRGLFARLVGDDRIEISTSAGRLLARGHPRVAGLIEERGTGVVNLPFEAAAIVRCIVDLSRKSDASDVPRLPGEADLRTVLAGVNLPRLGLSGTLGPEEAARRVLAHLAKEGA